MNNPIISTEGLLKGYKAGQVISSIVIILVGFFSMCLCFVFGGNPASYILLVMGIVIMIYGFFTLIVSNMRSRTYIKIYTDKVEGVGIQGSKVASFNVSYSQITGISTEKDWVMAYTDIGTFKILTTKETSIQILDYYNKNICNK